MKIPSLLLCLFALAATPLEAAVDTEPSAKKKRSTPAAEKARAGEDAAAPTKPFFTPAPAKKKPATAAEDDEPAPVKKKTTPRSGEATPAPAKKKKAAVTDEDAPPAKKKIPADEEDEPSSTSTKKSAAPPKDDAGEPELKRTAATPAPKPERAPSASLEPAELTDFAEQPAKVQQLLTAALALTKLNLTYTFGSADPAKGGMDCSGTIHHLLRAQGFEDVPRDSSGQYSWVRKAGRFFSVLSAQGDGFEFSDLEPGDLMFWTGTYQTGRDIPVSHVMLYLGREKKTGKRVMFGASDGRSYAGVQRWGVSVFDFKMPKADPAQPEKRVDFVGYAPIPGLRAGR